MSRMSPAEGFYRQRTAQLEAENARLRRALETVECCDMPGEYAGDAFDAEPPSWAKDSFNGDEASQCGYCNSWMVVVRPGKVQCDTCCDGKYMAHFVARQALADAEDTTGGE